MTQQANYSKSLIAQAMIEKIEDDRHPNKIKTKYLNGYPSPGKIKLRDEQEREELIYPDIVAEYDNETHLYEIELDEDMNFQKWKFMSLYAKEKNGNLYLIIPDFMRSQVKKSLNEKNINAAVIYFETKKNVN